MLTTRGDATRAMWGLLKVPTVLDANRRSLGECLGHSVLAHDANRGELDLHGAFAVAAAAQEEKRLSDIIADHTDVRRELRENPNMFALTESPSRVVRHGLLSGQ